MRFSWDLNEVFMDFNRISMCFFMDFNAIFIGFNGM